MKRWITKIFVLLGFWILAASAWTDEDISQKLHPALIREFNLGGPARTLRMVSEAEIPEGRISAVVPPRNPGAPADGLNGIPTTQRVMTDDGLMLEVMIRFNSKKGKLSQHVDRLQSLGLQTHTISGPWVTALMPLGVLNTLVQDPAIQYIHASQPVEPCMDISVPDTRADELHSPSNVKGQGVLVGIVDTGIDLTHEDFKKSDGTSRVQYVWDQTDNGGPTPNGFSYGSEWTPSQVQAGQSRQTDTDGHGTHVAGSVAGDGSSTGQGQAANRFVGMAPEADIFFVKYNDSENSIVDGVNYLLQKAESLSKPISINLSLATQRGPHDGTYPQDQMLNGMVGSGKPGKILCIAASNEGDPDIPIHAGGMIKATDGQGNYTYTAHRPWQDQQFFFAEIWYPAGQSVKLRVWIPTNQEASQFSQTNWVGPGENVTFDINTGPIAGAKVQIIQQSPWQGGDGSLNYAEVSLWNPNHQTTTLPIGNYVYWIDYDGAGVPFDVWQPIRNTGGYIGAAENDQWIVNPDNRKTVGSPGSTKNAITVGSYVTKTQWTDIDGQNQTQQYATVGEISVFSSRGPLRDGARKPEITAPGEAIISSLSNQAQGLQRHTIERDGVHVKMQGTSMASPHVAGGCALVLQADPTLDNIEMRQLLHSHAIDVADPGWDYSWGFGKMDIKAVYDEVATQQQPTSTMTSTPESTATATPTEDVPQDTSTPTATYTPDGGQGLLMDANRDGMVDAIDMHFMVREWKNGPDLLDGNSDGQVNYWDLFMMASEFGQGQLTGTPTPTETHPVGVDTPTPTPTATGGVGTYQLALGDYSAGAGQDFQLEVTTSAFSGMAGLYFDIGFDPSQLEATADASSTAETADFRMSTHRTSGKVKVAMARSTNSTEPGGGALIRIPMRVKAGASPGTVALLFHHSFLYDEQGEGLAYRASNGSVEISGGGDTPTATSTPTVSPTPDSTVRQVSVLNYLGDPGSRVNIMIDTSQLQGMAGGYFRMEFNPDILSADPAVTTVHTAGYRISSLAGSGSVTIALAAAEGNSTNDSGQIVQVPMQVSASAVPGSQTALILQTVQLYDEKGVVLSTNTLNGEFTVTGTLPTVTETPQVSNTPTPTQTQEVTSTPTATTPPSSTPTSTPSATLPVTSTPTSTPTPDGSAWTVYPADPNEDDFFMPDQDISQVAARVSGGNFEVSIQSYAAYPADLSEIFMEVAIDADNDYFTGYFGVDYRIIYGTATNDNFYSGLFEYNPNTTLFDKVKDLGAPEKVSGTEVRLKAPTSDLSGFSGALEFYTYLTTYDEFFYYEDYAPDGDWYSFPLSGKGE